MLPALAVPAFAATSIKDDPTFAAIDRARKEYKEFLALAQREDAAEGASIKLDKAPDDHRTPEMVAAVKESIAARIALAHTVPTTPAGLIALLAFVREYSIDNGSWGFDLYFDGNDEQYAHAYSVEMAIRGMAGELRNWDGLAVALPSLAVPAMASMPPADVDQIFAAIEKHQQAEAAFGGIYDNEIMRGAVYLTPAIKALEDQAGELCVRSNAAYVELVKLTPTTLAGCAALLRHLEAHERSYDQPALLANHNHAKVAARDLLSRIAAMLASKAVQS
jgi:hypothetical protein